MRIVQTTSEAYLRALEDVLNNYEYTPSPRGQKTREILDYTFKVLKPTMDPIETKDASRNTIIKDYSKKEFELYDSCTNRVEDFAKASKFWNHLQNPDGTVNSAYGHLIWNKKSHGNFFEHQVNLKEIMRCESDGIYGLKEGNKLIKESANNYMRTPWEWAKMCLRDDKDTRQAILRFSLPEHQWKGNLDQTCTLTGLFIIRDNKLNLTITMRSNDLMRGLVYDLPWFVSLIYRMRDELKDVYPNLEIGTYTHCSHSMHLYEKDLPTILNMLGYLEKKETEKSKESGRISLTPKEYKDIVDGVLPGFYIKDSSGTHFLDSARCQKNFYLGTDHYVVVNYK